MTVHPQLYLTAPGPCPYIEDQQERKIFTHLAGERAHKVHDELSSSGFRRSQSIAYKPACEGCTACIATRVLVGEFAPSKSMRRIIRNNRDLIGLEVENTITSEQYSLFRHYLTGRHGEGGMAEMSLMDFAAMVEDSHVETGMIEYRKRGPDSGITGRGEGPLIAAVLFDRLSNGLSMVYSFFDPVEHSRSLGTFVILDMIRRASKEGLAYCHLGYWVEASHKMAYKSRFLPQERLLPKGWTRFER